MPQEIAMFAEHLLHADRHRRDARAARAANSAVRVLAQIRQCCCAVRGHDLLLHFERRRLSLQCAACGWESPGWTIDTRAISLLAAARTRRTSTSATARKDDSHDYDTHSN